MAIAAAQASAMVGVIYRGLVAARDRLPVVIAEATCHTRSKPSVVERAKEMIQPHFEGPVHPADHVLGYGHASFFGGMWIFPREVLNRELRNSFLDSAALAVLLDCRLDLFLYFDGIDLPRAFVHRPEILVDALFAQDALVRSFERTHIYLWLGKRHFYGWISDGGSTKQNCQATAYETAKPQESQRCPLLPSRVGGLAPDYLSLWRWIGSNAIGSRI